MKNLLALIILILVSKQGFSQETIYFSSTPKNIIVNSVEETGVRFPSPVETWKCLPGDSVTFQPVIDAAAASAALGADEKIEITEDDAKMLRLIPKKIASESNCTFRLATKEIIQISFSYSSSMSRQFIDLRPASEKVATRKTGREAKVKGENILLSTIRDFLKMNCISYMIDRSDHLAGKQFKTKSAKYLIEYVASDDTRLAAWRIRVEFLQPQKSTLRLRPRNLLDTIAETMIDPASGRNIKAAKAGDIGMLYVLTNHDLTLTELSEMFQ